MALQWWAFLLLTLAPLSVLQLLLADALVELAWLHLPLFVAGLCSLFVSLPLFRRYKHALIATAQARDSAGEAAAWQRLAGCRQQAMLVAALPAWMACAGLLIGLNLVALLLLALSSTLVLLLYRIPAQLG
jgi:hypothetical protein